MCLILNPWETARYHTVQRNLILRRLVTNGEGETFAPTSGFAGLMDGEEWFLGEEVKTMDELTRVERRRCRRRFPNNRRRRRRCLRRQRND